MDEKSDIAHGTYGIRDQAGRTIFVTFKVYVEGHGENAHDVVQYILRKYLYIITEYMKDACQGWNGDEKEFHDYVLEKADGAIKYAQHDKKVNFPFCLVTTKVKLAEKDPKQIDISINCRPSYVKWDDAVKEYTNQEVDCACPIKAWEDEEYDSAKA